MVQNARGLPETSRDTYGPAKLDDAYDYDQNGNVAAITDALTGNRGNRDMTYDGLDRLKTAVSPMFGNAAYTYDALDNLTRVTIGGIAARDHYYCYDGFNQLTNIKTGSCAGTSVIGLGYDVQGNLNNKNGQVYVFDFGNRLRGVNGIASYVYDGHGLRVRDYTTASKYSFYSQAGQLVYANDLRTAKQSNYFYLGGSLVAIREQPTGGTAVALYQHTDALGSPVAVTNAARTIVEESEYEPYGGLLNRPLEDGPGYTGHVSDAATGLSYMQQRYYDPVIGRFLSRDPVTANPNTGANFNAYWYANNNPYRFVDPDGRRSTVKDDKINIDVEDKSLPTITIPNTVGAKGISPADKNDHAYDVRTSSSLTPAQAAEGFKNNPTPGNDSPASPMGTLNNVGNIPTAGDTNMVRSFTVASPDPAKYTDITVNYTVAGQHGLHEGFVVRYGEIGASGVTLRSYGEGSNSRQSMNYRDLPLIGWGAKVDAVWQQNHQEIINGSR